MLKEIHTQLIEAIKNGNLSDFNRLIEYNIDQLLSLNEFEAFYLSARDGQLPILERMIELAPHQLEDMLKANWFAALRFSADKNHIEIFERIFKLMSDKKIIIRESVWESIFKNAVFKNHLNIINRVAELVPEYIEEILEGEDSYEVYHDIVGNSFAIDVIERFIQLAPQIQDKMLSSRNFGGFRKAHPAVQAYLLKFPSQFAYAENRMGYKQIVNQFIQSTLTQKRLEKQEFLALNPADIFNVQDSEQSKLYFYITRHLIRLNLPEVEKDLQFLTNLPSVRRLIQENHLIRFAISLNNHRAIEILLRIPDVEHYARTNNFFGYELRDPSSLRQIANDQESSMRRLSSGEEQRLQEVLKKYEPQIRAIGIPHIMDELRKTLKKRYESHPAFIEAHQPMNLPFDWLEFQKLELNSHDRTQALKAYYQHPEHTAFRYLMAPNPWIHPDAEFVNRIPGGFCSTFEDYQFLIALHYLGAIDESSAPIDDYTMETRLEQFIKELALLGRAHNWDKTRFNPVTEQFEEYDDLEADKPSCYSGVKRRLFQSVRGHILFKLLSMDLIKKELSDFVRSYFINHIHRDNCVAIDTAWNEVCHSGTCSNPEALESLNVSKEAQNEFIQHLREKYVNQFDSDLSYLEYIHLKFEITSIFPNHAIRFGGEINLQSILAQKKESMTLRSLHMFSQSCQENHDKETDPDYKP